MASTAVPYAILPEPHPGQRAVLDNRRRFSWLAAGRRWRKTTLDVAIAVEEAMRGKTIIWGAPVFDQVYIGWQETKRAASRIADFNQSRMTASFPNSGRIVYRSLDDPDNARGHTGDGVIVDEAADVKEEAWYEVLRPMLMDTGGWAVINGTPDGKDWFWREHQAAGDRSDSIAWQIPTLGCAIVDGELIRAPHPLENPHIPFSEILQLYRSMPLTAFRQEILAEFVQEASIIYDEAWFREARFNAAEPANDATCVARWISWDTALEDTDTAAYSACVVGELTPDYRLFIRDVWRDKLTFPNLVSKIRQVAESYAKDEYRGQPKLQAVIIESKVSGISAYQTLTEAGDLPVPVVPFKPQGSKEQRAELAAVWCKQGCVWLPAPSPDVRWLQPLESELFSFPDSPNADQVDSFSQLILYVSRYLSTGRDARRQAAELLAQEATSVR